MDRRAFLRRALRLTASGLLVPALPCVVVAAPAIRRSPVWPDPRTKPPLGIAEADRGHPAGARLSHLWLLNEGAGRVFDLAPRGIIGGAPSGAVWRATALGEMGIESTNAGDVVDLDNPTISLAAGGFTVMVIFSVAGACAAGAGTNGRILTQGADGFGLFEGQGTAGTRTLIVQVLLSTTAVSRITSTNTTQSDANRNLYNLAFVTWDGGTAQTSLKVYVAFLPSGRLVEASYATGTDGAGILALSGHWFLGNRDAFDRGLNGSIAMVATFDGVLPLGVMQSMVEPAERYAMLRPIIRQHLVVPAAGGGGGTVADKMMLMGVGP